MSVSMFTNALRTQSRLRVLTATRVALPATRSISSLVGFRTAVPKNVSLSVSRSFTTSQVARNEFDDSDGPPRPAQSSNTVFVANIPWSATEEELTQVFAEFGEVINVRIHMNSDGRPRGIAHVDFGNRDSALAAIESCAQEPIHMAGRDLRVDFSAHTRAQPMLDPSEKLYFSGCAGDETEIRVLFGKFADSIVDIHLLKNPMNGESTRNGFIQLSSVELATEAIETLNGMETPQGEILSVSYARPRRSQSGYSQQDSRRGGYGQGYRQGQGSSDRGGRIRRSSPRWENDR